MSPSKRGADLLRGSRPLVAAGNWGYGPKHHPPNWTDIEYPTYNLVRPMTLRGAPPKIMCRALFGG